MSIAEILYKYNAGQISVNEAIEYLHERERQHAIDFEIWLMKEWEDISPNPRSVEHAYDNWKKLTS